MSSEKLSINDYDYFLPEHLIAQQPTQKREESKLLTFNIKNHLVQHQSFYDLVDILNSSDCLIVNNSKVIPARIWGKKSTTGKKTEFLWLNEEAPGKWRGLLRGKHKIGTSFEFGEGSLTTTVVSKNEDGSTTLELKEPIDPIPFLSKYGQIPLPPYILRNSEQNFSLDQERYQTLFAKDYGSVAAPTAGLHFSQTLLNRLKAKGIKIVPITLHVGLGTFQPVREETLNLGRLHQERYEISQESADIINQAMLENHRIITVGTTTCRALEAAATPDGKVIAGQGKTDLFIRPGYSFKVVKNLLTNFHLPKSSLLMLVSSLIGRETVLSLYKQAIEKEYRFFSYGDAMLVLSDVS